MRTLSVEPSFSGSTVKVRISNAYLHLRFTKKYYSRESKSAAIHN